MMNLLLNYELPSRQWLFLIIQQNISDYAN